MTSSDADLIQQLLPHYHRQHFETHFHKCTKSRSKSQQKRIRQELQRLTTPCLRHVDFRGKVAGQCYPFKIAEKTHWLDDVAMSTLKNRLQIYQGKLTTGLWEELHERTTPYQQEYTGSHHPAHLSAKPSFFGKRIQRQEDRLQISLPIEIQTSHRNILQGITLNLSSAGVKIKIPAHSEWIKNKTVLLQFSTLAEKFKRPQLTKGIEYLIVAVTPHPTHSKFQLLRLKQINHHKLMASVLSQLQTRQKKRVDVADVAYSIQQAGFEQLFWKHTQGLPVIVQKSEPTFAITTDSNAPVWRYWQNEKNHHVMAGLITFERLKKMLRCSPCAQAIFDCVQYKYKDKRLFLSMEKDEYPIQVKHQFQQFIKRNRSRRTFKFSELTTNEHEYSWFMLEDVTLEKLFEINEPHSEKTFSGEYLRPLVHQEFNPNQILPLTPQLSPTRRESRYQFTTHIQVKDTKGRLYQAQTLDFSSQGLHVVSKTSFQGAIDEQVFVDFQNLMNQFPDAPLKEISYQVVYISTDGLRLKLRLCPLKKNQLIQNYLEQLIQRNPKQFSETAFKTPSKIQLLKDQTTCLSHLKNSIYFLGKSSGNIAVSAIFPSQSQHKILSFLHGRNESGHVTLCHFFSSHLHAKINRLAKLKMFNQVQFEDFYIALEWRHDEIQHINIQSSTHFHTTAAREYFIRYANKRGTFLAIRNSVQAIEHAESALDRPMLESIFQKSPRKACQIEASFEGIQYYGELIDITDVVISWVQADKEKTTI